MAGDWIKMRVALAYDLKVMQIARALNGESGFLNQLAPDCQIGPGRCNVSALHTFVIGALHRFWCAAQEITSDGSLGNLECNDIDCLVGCFGFCEAMIDVGWIEVDAAGKLQVHNWSEHNGESAKKRAMGKRRVEKHREIKRDGVTPVAEVKRKNVTREEKRREECKGMNPLTIPSCSELAAQDSEPPLVPPARGKRKERQADPVDTSPVVLVFPATGAGAKSWGLTQNQLDSWQEVYPTLDVLAECKKSLVWQAANGAKTAGGMTRHLVRWLNRAVNDRRPPAAGSRPAAPAPNSKLSTAERARIACEANGLGGR